MCFHVTSSEAVLPDVQSTNTRNNHGTRDEEESHHEALQTKTLPARIWLLSRSCGSCEPAPIPVEREVPAFSLYPAILRACQWPLLEDLPTLYGENIPSVHVITTWYGPNWAKFLTTQSYSSDHFGVYISTINSVAIYKYYGREYEVPSVERLVGQFAKISLSVFASGDEVFHDNACSMFRKLHPLFTDKHLRVSIRFSAEILPLDREEVCDLLQEFRCNRVSITGTDPTTVAKLTNVITTSIPVINFDDRVRNLRKVLIQLERLNVAGVPAWTYSKDSTLFRAMRNYDAKAFADAGAEVLKTFTKIDKVKQAAMDSRDQYTKPMAAASIVNRGGQS